MKTLRKIDESQISTYLLNSVPSFYVYVAIMYRIFSIPALAVLPSNVRCTFFTQTHNLSSYYLFIFSSLQCLLKYPLWLRLMSLLSFLYLPNTRRSQCHTVEGRTQIALTYVLTPHYLFHINFPGLLSSFQKICNLVTRALTSWQYNSVSVTFLLTSTML